jgi:hypothetical protein
MNYRPFYRGARLVCLRACKVSSLFEPVGRRRIAGQDVIAGRFIRRPIGQEADQDGVAGLGAGLPGRVGPAARPGPAGSGAACAGRDR